jgi:asparagine synthase (glutamine-hydrolysing)
MCGIAGYLNLTQSNFCIDPELLTRMQQAIAHRGPDGHETWVSADRQVGLIHRRLAIQDLSDAGKQPMQTRDGSLIITFNGEIYNAPELRAELELLGYRYFSTSDTESILYAYQAWGIAGLNRLEGMFAFALYDIAKDEMYLVRDRIGIKPMYFSLQGGVLSFASEIKALWQLPWIKKETNPLGLYHYLTFMVTPAPMTLFKEVYKLPAGFYAKVDTQRNVSYHQWYDVLQPEVTYDPKDLANEQFCIEQIRTLLRQSIKSHTLSDVPYGVFLSGGIDSSLNTALMAEFTEKVKTYNVSFSDGPEQSEVAWARKVSKLYNTEHHEIEISEKEAFEFFQKMVYHQDEPLADCVCIPLYYVSKLLRDSGTIVVQVGEGSDELFCGYSTYAKYLNWHQRYWQPGQRYMPAWARKGAYQIAKPFFAHRPNYRDLMRNWADDRALFWGGATAFLESWKGDLWQGPLQGHDDPVVAQIYPSMNQNYDSHSVVDYHLQQLYAADPHADFFKAMTYLELKQRLPELLLMRVDKMGMATSIEGRVPFLDRQMVEFAMQIPTSLKYRNGITKYILKKACEGILPDDVIYRPKMGFAAPIVRWFKHGSYFKPYLQDLLATKKQGIASMLNMPGMENLLLSNQQPGKDYSLQLWVAQNVLALD